MERPLPLPPRPTDEPRVNASRSVHGKGGITVVYWPHDAEVLESRGLTSLFPDEKRFVWNPRRVMSEFNTHNTSSAAKTPRKYLFDASADFWTGKAEAESGFGG